MNYIITFSFLLLLSSTLMAESKDTNAPEENSVITIKDTSGLSEKEIMNIAIESDKEKQNDLVTDSMIDSYNNENAYAWERLAPTPVNYDWIELKSGEWLKGKFKAYQDNDLEFDSDKLNLLTFEFKDIFQLRTHKIMTVSIQTKEDQNSTGFFKLDNTKIQVSGIIRLTQKSIKIIQGNNTLEFPRSQVISIAHSGEKELNYWSGKATVSYNQKIGNSDQLDFNTQVKLQRRTSTTRLMFTYLGNISQKQNESTTDNHRLKETFDLFITRKFFLTALSLEYFSDPFQNIQHELTKKVAVGYTVARNSHLEWDISSGPALIQTRYETVEKDSEKESQSWAAQLNTKMEIAIAKNIESLFGYRIFIKDMDLILDYQFTFTDALSGDYKHHMLTKLENELTSWLDLDFTFIWDYLHSPTKKEDATVPQQDDYQILVGLGIDF
ncbi:MAG: DUF481 domain-containing protein [Campylobacterota bacterium]|nr:DUF481 domain-containing protein [Campylobacterota bacterium]